MDFSRFNVQKINTISTNVSTLLTRLTATRAALLDNLANIANSNLLTVPNMTNFPPAVQAYLNNANLPSIPNLANFTSTRQVYIDAPITSRAAASTALDSSDISDLDAAVSSRAPSSTALSTATWTAALAGNLVHVQKLITTVEYILGTSNVTVDLSGFGGTAAIVSAFVEASGYSAAGQAVGSSVEVDFFVDNVEKVSNFRVVGKSAGEMAHVGNTGRFDVTAHITAASQTCKVVWDLVGNAAQTGAKLVVTLAIT